MQRKLFPLRIKVESESLKQLLWDKHRKLINKYPDYLLANYRNLDYVVGRKKL